MPQTQLHLPTENTPGIPMRSGKLRHGETEGPAWQVLVKPRPWTPGVFCIYLDVISLGKGDVQDHVYKTEQGRGVVAARCPGCTPEPIPCSPESCSHGATWPAAELRVKERLASWRQRPASEDQRELLAVPGKTACPLPSSPGTEPAACGGHALNSASRKQTYERWASRLGRGGVSRAGLGGQNWAG